MSNPPHMPVPQPDAHDGRGNLPPRGRQRERTPHAGQHYRTPSYPIDVTMHSPPKDSIPANGSSRSTQGIFRGRASGNTFNIGDVEAVWDNINKYNQYPDGEPKKGKIYLYISELNPSTINVARSDFVATIYDTAKCQTVQDVMKLGSRNYSPIRSKFFLNLGWQVLMNYYLEPAYRLFIRDEDDWCAQGRYESIMSRTSTSEDYIKWMKDEDDKEYIRVLGTTFDPSGSMYIPGFAGRSTSLGSGRSTSLGSSSVPPRGPSTHTPAFQHGVSNPHAQAFQQGSSNPYAFNGRNMASELRDRLIEELGIDILFTDRSKTGIRVCWGRYLEIVRSIEQARTISEAGNWPVDLPSFSEVLIVEVFISKSAWHKYKNQFTLVKQYYPGMIDWLNNEATDEEEDCEVWGNYRSKYTLEDLKEFLDLGGKLKKTRTRSSDEEDRSTLKGKGKSHRKSKYNK